MPQAPRIPKTAWEAHKDLICSLYLVEGKTLDEVIQYMDENHAFCASKPQYIRKLTVNWGLRKNSTKEEWEQANALVLERQAEGKPTELMMNGIMIPSKKKKKEMNRYKKSQTQQLSVLTNISDAVVAWTPSPVDKPLILRGTLPLFQFQDILGDLGFERSVEVAFNKIAGPFNQSGTSQMPLLKIEMKHLGLQMTLPQILASLDERLPVRYGYKNYLQAHDKSRSATWIQLFYALAFLLTNRLVHEDLLDQLFQMAISSNTLLEGLKQVLQVNGPTAKMLAVHFLFCSLKIQSTESLEFTNFLLKRGVSSNSMRLSRYSSEMTALQTAVLHNNEPAVKCLLQYNADPNTLLRHSKYPLSMAVDMRRSSIAQALIHAGANVNLTDPMEGYKTPLLRAIDKNNVTLVRLLLQAGADPGYVSSFYLSTLHRAIRFSYAPIVDALTEAGANPNMFLEPETLRALIKGFSRREREEGSYMQLGTPLQAAVERGDLGIVKCLVKAGATPNGVIDLNLCDDIYGIQDLILVAQTPLVIAVRNRAYDIVKFLLRAGADVNFQSSMLLSPLQCACGLGISEDKSRIIKLLLDWGAEIDGPPNPEGGRTALQAAAEVGDCNLVQDLLLIGASLELPAAEKDGMTVLEVAMRSGCIDLVELLLCSLQEPCPDVQNCWRSGLPHLEAAAASGNVQLVNKLLETLFSLENLGMEEYGVQAFKAAISIGSLSTVQRLFEIGADINAKETACSILCKAIFRGDEEIVGLLISKFVDLGLSLDDALPGDATPLWAALLKWDEDTVKRLIEAGANVDRPFSCNRYYRSYDGDTYATALGHATRRFYSYSNSLITILLEAGADPNYYAGGHYTPFLRVVVEGDESVAKILLAYGADPNKRCLDSGFTALELLFYGKRSRKSFLPLTKLLIDHGFDVTAPSTGGSPLQEAISVYPRRFSSELIQMCRLFLDAGADVNAPAKLGVPMTAIQHAIITEAVELIDLFLDAGADIHAPAFPVEGMNALQAAARTGNLKLVEKLVTQGVDVNAEPAEEFGATALQFAAMEGYVNVAIYLLENGALINAPAARREGRTALQGAAEHGRLDMIYLLLENDDDAETVEQRCQDAAKFAEAEFHPVIAEILREYKRPW